MSRLIQMSSNGLINQNCGVFQMKLPDDDDDNQGRQPAQEMSNGNTKEHKYSKKSSKNSKSSYSQRVISIRFPDQDQVDIGLPKISINEIPDNISKEQAPSIQAQEQVESPGSVNPRPPATQKVVQEPEGPQMTPAMLQLKSQYKQFLINRHYEQEKERNKYDLQHCYKNREIDISALQIYLEKERKQQNSKTCCQIF